MDKLAKARLASRRRKGNPAANTPAHRRHRRHLHLDDPNWEVIGVVQCGKLKRCQPVDAVEAVKKILADQPKEEHYPHHD